jgi:hypothetical protein
MTLAISSILSPVDFPDPEGPPCSLNFLFSLFTFFVFTLSFQDAIILDSISTASSCILGRSKDRLSLNNKAKSGSKAPA